MSLFGSSKRGRGLVATPDQEEESRRIAMKLGVPYEFDAPDAGAMSAPQERPQGFWQGGDKFRAKDGLAGILAVIGDVAAQQGGGQGGAVNMLASGRMQAAEAARKAQAAQIARQQGLEDYEAQKQIDQRFREPPQPTGTTRLIDESANWTPQQWERFNQLNPVQGPDGRYYPRATVPTVPVGPLTPLDDGGPTPPASGGFPYWR